MSRYLEQVSIGRYGALSDCEVGPFEPGLNVVFGPNEAGKSTVASFVGGVLFGWEEAHGVRNTYRPEEGHRWGSLVFAHAGRPASGQDGWDDERAGVVSRAHNADGLQGDSSVVADIDNATFRTMFHLTSDELRSLNNTSDITARLLTAGSGTGSSPAAAFVEIEQRIAAHTARSGDHPESIVQLGERLEAKREMVQAAAAEVELRKQEDRERADLADSRATTLAKLNEVQEQLEDLHEARSRLGAIDARMTAKRDELDALSAELASLAVEQEAGEYDDSPLMELDAAAERSLRDKLGELADEQAKIERSVDAAKENSATSTAAYEALLEIDDNEAVGARNLRNRTAQIVVSALLPVMFIVGGIPVFVHGRQIQSLSFTAFGIGMIVMAFFLAAAALVVLTRPNRGSEALVERRKDAQWIMLQDRKKLDASLAEKEQFEERMRVFFAEQGLQRAQGSVRQAQALLDDARQERMRASEMRQRVLSVQMRVDTAKDALASLQAERREVTSALAMDEDVSLQRVDAVIRAHADQRDALSRAYEDMNVRYGELEERLSRARDDRTFDREKLEYQEMLCELRERKHDLVTLLLAKRMLEKSIAAWESRSQPEVYAQASELFETITCGAWKHVSMTAEGRLIATDAHDRAREVRHLSLGTCQQLYLSLRVAMLMHASDVGRSVPVIADDMLVHFDEQRRCAAARVLARLAEKRQVIVFTGHKETVEALRMAQPGLNYLEL